MKLALILFLYVEWTQEYNVLQIPLSALHKCYIRCTFEVTKFKLLAHYISPYIFVCVYSIVMCPQHEFCSVHNF